MNAQSPALPAAYAAFAPLLAALSEPLLSVLQGQLEQFERFAGLIGASEFAAQGEFEGLGGLTLRGDISRIVQSELLLRDEAPLEFLRRLAESETLYLQPQYADPGARHIYRVLVSVGPGSLGHGRIVALAALFFLARVADARGAPFHWCFLPSPEGAVWFDELTPGTLKRLLRAASYREMSADDAAGAVTLWDRISGAIRSRDSKPTDWIIGAQPRRGEAAVSDAAQALAFALRPAAPGEPRAVHLALREAMRERSRADLLFPDDRLCVSALRDPFRPLTPQQLPAGTPSQRTPPGWAPRYFCIPSTNTKLVRMETGLLIQILDPHSDKPSWWFVPLAPDVKLAGVRLHQNTLLIAVHSRRSGSSAIAYGVFQLHTGGGAYTHKRVADTLETAWCGTQHPYAIPSLSIDQANLAANLYSASGALYPLSLKEQPDSALRRKLDAAELLWSNGAYQVVREGGPHILSASRVIGGALDAFDDGHHALSAGSHYGLHYSLGGHTLACSLAPDHWEVCAARDPKAAADAPPPARLAFTTAGHETLLTASLHSAGISARLWSDTRRGGDGTVRNIRVKNGETRTRDPLLKLGDDAGAILHIAIADDGVWALAMNEAGEPARLLHYRAPKGRDFVAQVYDLEEAQQNAVHLEMEALHG